MTDTPTTIEAPAAPEATEERLRATIARLQTEGHLSETDAARMQAALPETLKESTYILRHLTAHWAIGAIFAFDLVPLPLGTIARVCYVLGNRLIETCLGRWERASVHSLVVLGTSAIPVAGYFAYLIPLRSRSADAAFLYANHFAYSRSNCALPPYLERRPKWIAWIVRKMVGVPVKEDPATGSDETGADAVPSPPSAGEKVADRPDEGACASIRPLTLTLSPADGGEGTGGGAPVQTSD